MSRARSLADLANENLLTALLATTRIGIGTTDPSATLEVSGDARVTGIMTVGSSSLTFDGDSNVVNVGTALTLGHTQGVQFHTQNLHSTGFEVNNVNASGVITATSFVGDGSNLTGLQAGYFEKTDAGINTSTNIGIGTTNPTETLTVSGTAKIGALEVGIGNTDVIVTGDMRVTGILSVGQGTITLDPSQDEIKVGATKIKRNSSSGEIEFRDLSNNLKPIRAKRLKSENITEDTSGNLEITGIVTATSFNISNIVNINSGITTLTTTTQTAILSFSTSTYRSVEFTIQATEGTNYHGVKVLVLHDGTTASNSQYGEIITNTSVASFDADISGGNVRLLATGASANSTTYKVAYTGIQI